MTARLFSARIFTLIPGIGYSDAVYIDYRLCRYFQPVG